MRKLNTERLLRLIKKVHPYLKILLVLLVIVSNFKSLMQQLPENKPVTKNDAVFMPKWEKRFEPIKEKIPFENGVIGYASEGNISGTDPSDANAMSEHILTQFAMAPIIVSDKTDFEWILVNMEADDFNNWLEMQSGEYEVMNYKYNLHLVHKIK